MNRQPNSHNSHTARTLNTAALNVSQKENAMNRRIATVLFVLFSALVLSACAVQSPFQTPGSVTVLPKTAGPVITGPQVNDRQQLANYQASLPAVSLVSTALKSVKASGVQINDRQQLADYQASLPAVSLVAAAPKSVAASGVQINGRQQLAEYQASLPLYTAKTTDTKTIASVTTIQQINDRQALTEYQASLR